MCLYYVLTCLQKACILLNKHMLCQVRSKHTVGALCFTIYEGRAKSLRTFLIIFIIDVRSFSYFHKCNNGLLSIFMQNIICRILLLIG